jgi:DNA-binding NtrC family response regulator
MISIIDDDVCAREATEAIIRSLGYALATYESAEDFLGSENINDTSCLITDVHMPGLNGVELYQRLRADGFAENSSATVLDHQLFAAVRSRLLSGHFATESQCPLLGVKRTSKFKSVTSVFDPERKSSV